MKRLMYVALMAAMVVLYSIPVDAQYKIVNYTDMNQINSLTDDGDYIWVCTSGGAYKRKKSDGSLVKVFNIENSGISRNDVKTMYIDIYGNYWFGTNNGGISKFDGVNWTSYNEINGERIYTISRITEDLSGNLWFGEQGKVFKFDGTNWTKYILSGDYYVKSIVPDDDGNIWFGIVGYHGAFWKMDAEGVLSRIPGPANKFIDDDGPYDIMKDSYGNLWIAYYGGFYKYTPKTENWQDFGGVIGTNIYAITQDNRGRVWFGTGGGVYKYDGLSFTNYLSGRTGDRVDMALDVQSDAQGNVWVGGYAGFAKVDEVAGKWTTPVMLNCLPNNWVETVVFDTNNKPWVYGQFDNTLKYDGSYWSTVSNSSSTPFWWIYDVAIDNANSKFFAFPGSDTKLRILKMDAGNITTAFIISGNLTYTYANEVVQDVEYDAANGKIWVATNQGLFWYKISDNSFGQFNQSAGELKSNNVKGLAIKGSKVWYSTSDAGIGYYDQGYSGWKGYSKSDGLPVNDVGELVFDASDNLWMLVGGSGLTKFDGAGFQNFYPSGIGLSQIASDKLGNIWVGGWGGVAKFRDGNFKYYTAEDGLIENRAGDIVVDALNNVWITTSQFGLSKMVPQAPVAEFTSNVVCLPGVTFFTNTSTKMDLLSKYEWDFYNDGSIDYTTRDVEHVFEAKTTLDVRLRVYNDGLSSEIVHTAKVLESPNLSLNAEGDKSICFGESQDIQVIINNYDPLLIYQVSWSNGINGTQQIWASEAGPYMATVNNGECEISSPILNLAVNQPFAEEKICMVTVDPETGKNLIVWERTADAGVSSYNIYKLFGNTYVPIGNVSSLDISAYLDYTSTPDALAARYAISSIDTCGNESEKSAYHQTIYLGASKGSEPNTIVLDWTNYIDESKIWQPAWYYVYRGSDSRNLVLHDSISSAFTKWNDKDPGDNRYYQIMVKKSNPCVPLELSGKKTSSGPFVHSLSNLEDNRLQSTGIDGNLSPVSIGIYPNPFKTEATIKWPNPDNTCYSLKLFDLRGSLIRQVENITGSEYQLMRHNLESGIYLLEIKGEKLYKTKIIVQ